MRQERKGHKLAVLALMLALVVGLGVALLPLPAYADPDPGWYNASWACRKQITFTSDTSKIPSTQSYFPVLINLSSDTDLAAHAQNDGDDILFTSSDGTTQLDHEIEKFDGGTGELVAWVEVPSLSTGTVIYMYYGNATCGSQEDVEHTWDGGTDALPANNFVLVQHLQEDPSGTPPQMIDSTSNNNDGTQSGGVTQDTTGQINGADDFDGADDFIGCGAGASLDITEKITYEAWIKVGTLQDWATIAGRVKSSSWADGGCSLYWYASAVSFWVNHYDTNRAYIAFSDTTNWHYVVGTYDKTTISVYLDGTKGTDDTCSGMHPVRTGLRNKI